MNKSNIKVIVMSYQDLLRCRSLYNNLSIHILITSEINDYFDFGHTHYTKLSILDTDNPKIRNGDVYRLQNFIGKLKDDIELGVSIKTIYVCCDAGIRRSPALALYICSRLGLDEQAKQIINKCRFLHQKLYDNLCKLNLEI